MDSPDRLRILLSISVFLLFSFFVCHFLVVCKKPTRSTQPCIPSGPLNRVPASCGVKAGMSALPGGR